MAYKRKTHACENCGTEQERFVQEGSVIPTNAKPLNNQVDQSGKPVSLNAGVKTYDSRTAFGIPSTTDGRGRAGIEGHTARNWKD